MYSTWEAEFCRWHAEHHQQRAADRHQRGESQQTQADGLHAVDRSNVGQWFHAMTFVGQLAAVQVAPQAGTAVNHQADADIAFGHTDFVAHDRRKIRVEDVGGGCAEDHIRHTELDAAVEEQAELPQETDLRRMRITWQRHCHRCHQHGGEHRDQGKGDTPAESIGHPSAGRCADHGSDGETREYPGNELGAVFVGGHVGREGHGDGHQRAGHGGDEQSGMSSIG